MMGNFLNSLFNIFGNEYSPAKSFSVSNELAMSPFWALYLIPLFLYLVFADSPIFPARL